MTKKTVDFLLHYLFWLVHPKQRVALGVGGVSSKLQEAPPAIISLYPGQARLEGNFYPRKKNRMGSLSYKSPALRLKCIF